MGEYYNLVNLDTRDSTESRKLAHHLYDCKIPIDRYIKRDLNTDALDDIRNQFARVVYRYKGPPNKIPAALRTPVELLAMIFKEIDNLEDIICLSLTEMHFLDVGFEEMVKRQLPRLPTHAGARLMFLGDSTKDKDYPPNIQAFVSDFLEKKRRNRDSYYCDRTYAQYFRGFEPGDLERILFITSAVEQESLQFKKLPWRYFEDRAFSKAFQTLLFPSLRGWCKPPPRPEVLCNLTEREYVYAKDIDKLVTTRRKEGFKYPVAHPNIMIALLLLTCWSSYVSDTLKYAQLHHEVHRGSWAGDRIEITSKAALVDKPDFAEWFDSTDDIIRLIDDIWVCDGYWGEKVKDKN